MNVIIRLEGPLRFFADNLGEIPIQGNTVGDCIEELIRRFPEIDKWLFDKNGILKSLIILNGQVINAKGFGHIVKNEDELRIVLITAGG